MTEEVKDQQSNVEESELDSLKKRADQMGLKYHHMVGVKKLKALVNSALQPEVLETEKSGINAGNRQPAGVITKDGATSTPVKLMPKLTKKDEAAKLVRIRVNCMNPNKQDYEGEIFTVGNREFGFKKYVPFNNNEGWHVPNMIYQHLLERKCQIFVNGNDGKGNKIRVPKLVQEFAVEVLEPLSPSEMQSLAQRQAMASGTT